jgi:anti-anti-sigma factor
MKISVNSGSEHVIVVIEGRLDTTQSDAFEKQMLEIIGSGQTKIILDCKALEYISSSGLRVFLIAQKKMMAISGKLLLCNLQPGIKEIFEVSGFSMIFSIYPDLETALDAV